MTRLGGREAQLPLKHDPEKVGISFWKKIMIQERKSFRSRNNKAIKRWRVGMRGLFSRNPVLKSTFVAERGLVCHRSQIRALEPRIRNTPRSQSERLILPACRRRGA
jgi:hypothetical protein